MTNRVLLAAGTAFGMVLAITPAAAQEAATAERLKMMLECDAIKNETIRLTCYDSAARRTRTSLGANHFGMLPGSPAAQPITPEQNFGMTVQVRSQRTDLPPPPQEVTEINSKVAGALSRGPGIWQIAFVDGTRWNMTESADNFSPPNRGEEVRIRKGTMGSFLMYVGNQPSFRVVRVH